MCGEAITVAGSIRCRLRAVARAGASESKLSVRHAACVCGPSGQRRDSWSYRGIEGGPEATDSMPPSPCARSSLRAAPSLHLRARAPGAVALAQVPCSADAASFTFPRLPGASNVDPASEPRLRHVVAAGVGGSRADRSTQSRAGSRTPTCTVNHGGPEHRPDRDRPIATDASPPVGVLALGIRCSRQTPRLHRGDVWRRGYGAMAECPVSPACRCRRNLADALPLRRSLIGKPRCRRKDRSRVGALLQ